MAKRLIDVAVNFTDEMFQGIYNGKKQHEADLSVIIERAIASGVERMVGVSGSLQDSETNLEIALKYKSQLFSTVGVHPTRCQEFEENPAAHYDRLLTVALRGKELGVVVGIGETGLDYDREQFCPRETQKKYFLEQFRLAKETQLPMLFHNRNTGGDFEQMVRENRSCFTDGVVHSFTGTIGEMKELVDMGLLIGINGCSLKTAELCEMISQIPEDNIVLETDAPWCEIRPTHAAFKHVKTTWPSVKKERYDTKSTVMNRYEPCHVRQVLEAVAGIRGDDVQVLSEKIWDNTNRVFKFH